MAPILGLQIGLRIPIRIVENAGIGRLEVDAKTTGAGGKDEGELGAVLDVEDVDGGLAIGVIGVAIDAAVLVAAHVHKILEDVQNARHLGEDEDSAATLLEPLEELVEHVELAAVVDQVIAEWVEGSVLHALEEIGMATALAQLHDDIEDGRSVLLCALSGDGIDIAKQQLLVQLLLDLGHTDHDEGLRLRRQALGNILLDTADHKGTEDVVKLGNHILLGLVIVDVKIEPLVELLRGREDVREEEVEQGPQFVQIVLQGSTGQEETVGRVEASHRLAEHGGLVLEAVGLVDDQIAPGELLEGPSLGIAYLVGGDAYIPLTGIVRIVVLLLAGLGIASLLVGPPAVVGGGLVGEELLLHGLPILLGTMELDDAEGRAPPLELVHPVRQGGLGNDDQMRTLNVEILILVGQDGDTLERLSQAHLIGQDAVQSLLHQVDHPVQSLQLVRLESSKLDARGLLGEEDVLLDVVVVVVVPTEIDGGPPALLAALLGGIVPVMADVAIAILLLLLLVFRPRPSCCGGGGGMLPAHLELGEDAGLLQQVVQPLAGPLRPGLVELLVPGLEEGLLLVPLPLPLGRRGLLGGLDPLPLRLDLRIHLGIDPGLALPAALLLLVALGHDALARAALPRALAVLGDEVVPPDLLLGDCLGVGDGRLLPVPFPVLRLLVVVRGPVGVGQGLPPGRELGHCRPHGTAELLLDVGELVGLEELEGRLGPDDGGSHGWCCCAAVFFG
mmetsp:Transcript_28915/g.83963  ORF Transcript_28915/g.83963 Transcript_28915/m.83963 type:complete len:731 (+) Transcript_28915:2411-4603(+)